MGLAHVFGAVHAWSPVALWRRRHREHSWKRVYRIPHRPDVDLRSALDGPTPSRNRTYRSLVLVLEAVTRYRAKMPSYKTNMLSLRKQSSRGKISVMRRVLFLAVLLVPSALVRSQTR